MKPLVRIHHGGSTVAVALGNTGGDVSRCFRAVIMWVLRTVSPARAAAVILLVHTGLLAWAAAKDFPTIDEMGHLPAGVSHWKFGSFDLYNVNPPIVRLIAALPVSLLELNWDWDSYTRQPNDRYQFELGKRFIHEYGIEATSYFSVARWACIPFSFIGGMVAYLWAKRLFGALAGVAALSFWCFSPTVLAYGHLITPDLGAASLTLAACYCFTEWLRKFTWSSAYIAGIALGLAQSSKTTLVVLFVVFPALWLISALQGSRTRCRRREAVQLCLIVLLTVPILNLLYGFEKPFQKLADFNFKSIAFGGDDVERVATGNRFQSTWLGELRVPVPANYLYGIDNIRQEFEDGYPSFLGGRWKHGGWPHYYAYALAVKETIGLWICVLLALLLSVTRGRKGIPWHTLAGVLAPSIAIFAVVSSQTGFNHHVRYVLPSLPMFFVVASAAFGHLTHGRPWLRGLAIAALLWHVASSVAVYPHSLSYFNELAGGPQRGNAHLHDSNVDWGQDLTYLQEWLQRHPEVKSIGVAAYHWIDPATLGIPSFNPPCYPRARDSELVGPVPGWYAISVNHLNGEPGNSFAGRTNSAYMTDPSRSYFRFFKPVERLGYSMNIYHVSVEEANHVRVGLGLSPVEEPISVRRKAPIESDVANGLGTQPQISLSHSKSDDLARPIE